MKTLEIWADLVCAWAYIGKRRLEVALDGSTAEPVEVIWRPFRIDPTAPDLAQPMSELLDDPVAQGALQACNPQETVADHRAEVARLAAQAGIDDFGARWRVNPADAHRLVHLAHRHGGAAAQDAIVERLLAAHFTQGADISDRQVLTRLAADAGVTPAATELDTDAGVTETRWQLLRGKALGIATSPTFVVGDRALSGAQSPEVLHGFIHAPVSEPRREPPEVTRVRLAESLLSQTDPLGALEMLGPMVTEFAEDPNVALIAARAYYASAQLERARRALEPLVANNPGDFYIRDLLGRTLRRLGRDAEAAPHLNLVAGTRSE